MCQPSHSIVQFEPPEDDFNSGDSAPPSSGLMVRIGKLGKWLKRIGGMFHASRMGEGHTGALGHQCGLRETFILPPARTDYEAHWWDRTLKMDGPYGGHVGAGVAQENAQRYADAVSIGSLHALRQFLSESFDNTHTPGQYVEAFRDILNRKGRAEYERNLKRIGAIRYFDFDTPRAVIESAKRLCLGLTRKRHLLVPEWADDKKLWVPSTSIVVPPTSSALVKAS
jgi:hypothetical protein